MRRGYTREVYPRIPTDRVKNVRPIHPVTPRFDEFCLYCDGDENCDVCGNSQVGHYKEWND